MRPIIISDMQQRKTRVDFEIIAKKNKWICKETISVRNSEGPSLT